MYRRGRKMSTTEIAGFVGAGLAGAAYVPQISHLIRARCSAGISRLAFEVWLLASLLTTARAIAIHAGVFIVLGGIEIVATALIMLCAIRYKDTPCPVHPPSPVCGQVSHWGGHLRKRAGRPAVHRTSNDTPEGDDMTASAGAATAAPEELSTAVPGETAGAQAAIVIVSRDPGAREILHQELIKRYGADYQIVVCDRPVELESWMRGLRAASRPVALVIGGGSAQDRDG